MTGDPFETAADEALSEGREHATPRDPKAGPDGADRDPAPRGSVPTSRRRASDPLADARAHEDRPLGRAGAEGPSPTGPDSIPASMPSDDATASERAEAARRSSDYVGDYPHTVPRWDEGEAATAGTRDFASVPGEPTGTRFGQGSAFDNAPGWFAPGPRNAQLCYWLNIGGFVITPLPFVTIGMALLNRGKVGPELATHYTYAMRTVLLTLLYGLLAGLFRDAAAFLFLGLVVWFGWRNLRGLARLGAGEPIPNPGTWWV